VTAFSPYPSHPDSASEYQDSPPPVLLAVADPAPQGRLTVLIRLILLVPHFIVLYILLLAGSAVLFVAWWGALFMGRMPRWASGFLAGILRWATRVAAYELLLTDAYPPFTFDDDPAYPVRLALPEPQRLNRAAVFFRFIIGFPANILAMVVVAGASTLMSFIAWLITLVAGQLPASYHQAFTAVVRFAARNYAYWWMLTPAYPGGLFGDKPGVPTWADQPAAAATAAASAAPGYGTAESVYGMAPGGYGAPYSPYAAAAAGPAAGPVPGGYGYPAAPGGRPLFQPASWSLLLTSGAKKLVTTFIVLGVVVLVADIGLQVARARSTVNAVVASNAITALQSSYGTLNSQMTASQNAVQACGQNLTCITRQNAKAATYFSTFASIAAGTPLPAGAGSDGARLGADATTISRDFALLGQATSVSQYESAVTSTGITKSLSAFNADYSALGEKLSGY
jgi:hypothetical protein